MSVYFVVHNTVTDQEKMDAYLAQVFATVPSEGMRLLSMDDAPETVEGQAPHQRLVIAEFDSKERFQAWYDSPEYTAIRQLQIDGTDGFTLLAEGAPQG